MQRVTNSSGHYPYFSSSISAKKTVAAFPRTILRFIQTQAVWKQNLRLCLKSAWILTTGKRCRYGLGFMWTIRPAWKSASPVTGLRWHVICTRRALCRCMNTLARRCWKRKQTSSIFWKIWTGRCRKNGFRCITSLLYVRPTVAYVMKKPWPVGSIRKKALFPRLSSFRCWKRLPCCINWIFML